MKRTLAILLLLLYTLTSTGATMYYHQCGQKTKISFSKVDTGHDLCELCLEKKGQDNSERENQMSCDLEKNCCSERLIELKNVEDQLAAYNFLQDFSSYIHPLEFLVPWILTGYSDELIKRDQGLLFGLSSSPPKSKETYIFVCNFRI